MNKSKKTVLAVLSTTVAAASIFSLTACNEPEPLTDKPLETQKIVDYTKADSDKSEIFASGSKGYSWENGDPFNVWWKPQNVSTEGGKLSLSISEMTEKEQKWDEEKQENVDALADYYGGEARSEHYYGYGDFQVRMKPAKIVGTASTFFTCTGPYDKWYSEDGSEVIKENKHDEIDIEFLGKDTTKVQFNYFAGGVGGHEYMYDLGFDASVEFHDYGYRWTETYITWFVDNVPVYRIDRKGNEAWPETAGRVIMNYWCSTENAAAWMGEFGDDYSGKAEYEYVATSATQCPDPNTAHIKDIPPVEVVVPEEGWSDISTAAFDGWGMYAIDKTDGLNISHTTERGSYNCCGMDLESSYKWVKFNVKNNDTVAAEIRLDIKNKDAGGAVEAVYPASDKVKVLTADAAAYIALDAGEELEVAVKLKEDIYVNQFVVFLNSTGTNAATGNITISELKGIIDEGAVPPAPPADTTALKIGDKEVTFGGDYTTVVSEDQLSMNIKYSDVSGKSYKNANTSIADVVGENNTLTFTVKNDGTETVKIRVDIGCATDDGSVKQDGEKNNFCNIKAEYSENVAESGNDYIYGGADWFKVAAGETVTVKVTFTENVAKDLKFYLDSSTWDDETTHSGDVTFSAFAFAKEEAVTPEPPVGGEVALTFTSTEAYTVDKSGEGANEVNVTYSGVGGKSYNNLVADVAALAADKDTFSMTIKNNGEETVKIRMDIGCAEADGSDKQDGGKNEFCNIKAEYVGNVEASGNDYIYGGADWVKVAAGETVTVIITFTKGVATHLTLFLDSSTYDDEGTHSGNVTLSGFSFN
ncbi:MAG: family 16 glycosylhydrolase [Clostridia bacterium]|nr:family 16 glycosylhydrolase [Clostridia bacterium]